MDTMRIAELNRYWLVLNSAGEDMCWKSMRISLWTWLLVGSRHLSGGVLITVSYAFDTNYFRIHVKMVIYSVQVSVPTDVKDEYKNVAEQVTGENRTCVAIADNGRKPLAASINSSYGSLPVTVDQVFNFKPIFPAETTILLKIFWTRNASKFRSNHRFERNSSIKPC